MLRTEFDIVLLDPTFIRENIDRFIEIATDIPNESWVIENYLYELPHKWEYSIGIVERKTGTLIAFIIASDKTSSIHIHKYAVHPDFRSRGVGRFMQTFFEKNVKRKADCKTISLYVDRNNVAAIRFYEREGFHFAETVESMLLYKKKLEIVVAIHQPNFFPWLGFFHKIVTADKFIILDNVTNKPSDGIYPKRVTIVCNSQPFWLTIPLIQPKDQLFIPLREMQISTKELLSSKHLKTIEHSYGKTPHYKKYFELFKAFYEDDSPYIVERNIKAIKAILKLLGFDTPISISSAYHFNTVSNQLLIDLVKAVNGDIYLHGSFAVSEKGYQDNELFIKNGIQLQQQIFQHPIYKQHNNKGDFISGVSIMDSLMNLGAEEVAKLVNKS
jgi:ribosomal protein S18 acetylase RimI-like enzyme